MGQGTRGAGEVPGGEFGEIARLFRPLTFDAPEARRLMDDAAILPGRPGFDLVVTQDAVVEGVHFLPDDPPALVGRKLLRVNLSDLAAKAAEPYAAFLTVAWPPAWTAARRAAFAEGLGEDLNAFACALMGGDTVSTSGPMVASLTLLGWAPVGRTVERAGAAPGDLLLVSGTIGDGMLGLEAARRGLQALAPELRDVLAARYRLPEPRLGLRTALRHHASAAADVSDGLLADAGHIGEASGCGVEIDFDRLPLSTGARAWLDGQPSRVDAFRALATGGDDYEVVCSVRPNRVGALTEAARSEGVTMTEVGRVTSSEGVRARCDDQAVALEQLGWTHG